MSGRTKLIAFLLALGIGASLATYVSTAHGQATPVIDVNRPPTPRFEVKVCEVARGWTAFKMDKNSGQTWRLEGVKWSPIAEEGTVQGTQTVVGSNFEMNVMVTQTAGYVVTRTDTQSGQTWFTEKMTWVDTK